MINVFTKIYGKLLLFRLSDTLNSVAREDVPTQIIQMFLVLQVSSIFAMDSATFITYPSPVIKVKSTGHIVDLL